jgi:hypothetical protein
MCPFDRISLEDVVSLKRDASHAPWLHRLEPNRSNIAQHASTIASATLNAMHSRVRSGLTISLALCAILGCATPGPPKPPSLNLPEPTRDLTATRIGNTVELRFTVPSRSTDKLPLRGANLQARFCRSLEAQPCQTLPATIVPLDPESSRHNSFTWTDTLPADLAAGNPRLLRYTVEILNVSGHSAGRSEPAFTAAGSAPPAITDLNAEGSRLGILLRWDAASAQGSEIVLQRQKLADVSMVQLAAPAGSISTSLLDTSAKLDTPYRYTATRSRTVRFGERSVELRSSPSTSVDLTLKAIYPPLAPSGLTAAPFTSAQNEAFAVDLIWQPVDDSGQIVPLAGYNVYRAAGDISTRLNDSPVVLPAFHDGTAVFGVNYRYRVTAVDAKGNESASVSVVVGP